MNHGKQEAKKDDLEKKFEECEKLKNEYLAGWQRARADFVNYKKEEDLSIKATASFMVTGIIREILSILDSFEIIEGKIPKNLKDDINVKGILQIKNQILNLLKKERVEVIAVKKGDDFNPSLHEAIEEVTDENMESGKIIEEVRKGYVRENRIIVPARVKITK